MIASQGKKGGITGPMARIVIDLDPDQKAWLDRQAAQHGVAPAELVRRAVRDFRAREEARPSFKEALERTAGIWRGEDGLDYQRRLRAEWR